MEREPEPEEREKLLQSSAPPHPEAKTAMADSAGVTKNDQAFRLFLLFMMTAQNTSVVLVSRYTRVGMKDEDLYNINDIVMITEVGKLVLAAALEYQLTNGHLLRSIRENIFEQPLDFFRILIPSLLYLMQNSMLYIAISNLTAPMFQVTYQCKLLTTAIVSVVMLNRRYNVKQWICLTVLGLGVAVVVLGASEGRKKAASDEGDKDDSANAQNLFAGLVAVTIACLCSAFAGVYFEKVLKNSTNDGGHARAPVSMWMRNVQMAFFSICIAMMNMYREYGDRGYTGETDADNNPVPKPFMHGFTAWAWVIVALQAGGGMLVAAVIKYADNVLKGMATGVSVATGTFFSMFLFGTTLSMQFGIGSMMILMSVYFFSNDLPASCTGGAKNKAKLNTEMKPMLPK
jgi:UDP-sugar transporter A1/2/3